MTVEEIKKNIKDYIINNFEVKNKDEIEIMDLDILKAGIVNSINVVQYLVFLEDEYDIDIIEENMSLEDVVNINKLSQLVYERIQNR